MESQQETQNRSTKNRDHLANERTFLAWIRTSVGIMAFGFVVEKFSLFIKELTTVLGYTHLINAPLLPKSYSSIFGFIIIAFGLAICIFSFFKYKAMEKQIENETYVSFVKIIEFIIAIFVLIVICLVVVLMISI
jgi:inner membrane protein YidH